MVTMPGVMVDSSGKELAEWIKRLFEVKINPDTLRKRAERLERKSLDKCPEQSKAIEMSIKTTPAIIADRKPQGGGAREGAGRALRDIARE